MFRSSADKGDQLRRVHWRVRIVLLCSVAVLALGITARYVIGGEGWAKWAALALVVGYLGGSVVYDWPRRGLVRVFARWPWTVAQLGMTVKQGETTVCPNIGRVWHSAHAVRVEYSMNCLSGKQPDWSKLASSLGYVSCRVVGVRPKFRGERVTLEFRTTTVLRVREVEPMMARLRPVSSYVAPEIPAAPTTATLPAGQWARFPVEPPAGSVLCPEAQKLRPMPERRQLAGTWVCSPGFDHLPHDCRPHLTWDDDRVQWYAFDNAAYLPVAERPDGCAPFGGEIECGDMPNPPANARRTPTLAELAVMAADPSQPRPQRSRPQRSGFHTQCIEYARRRLANVQAERVVQAEEKRASIRPVTDWRAALTNVEVGRSGMGGPWTLRLIDNHVLIAGITGAGKGSVIWSLVNGLAPAVAAGAVELWGLDPKRVELAAGRGLFDHYASDADGMLELLEVAVAAMQERGDLLATQRKRRFDPSPETPLHVLVIDELGYLTALLDDRQNAAKVDRALNTLLTQGRALGFCVIGGLQDARKKVIDSRDMWPTRVAMRMPRALVDLVLGSGSYERGAVCDQIPREAAGTAYVLDEETLAEPVEVRANWVSDQAIEQLERTVADWRKAQDVPPRVDVRRVSAALRAASAQDDQPRGDRAPRASTARRRGPASGLSFAPVGEEAAS